MWDVNIEAECSTLLQTRTSGEVQFDLRQSVTRDTNILTILKLRAQGLPTVVFNPSLYTGTICSLNFLKER